MIHIPPRETQLLLAHVLGRPREWVIAHPDTPLTLEQTDRYHALLARAEAGVPLPYLLGHWEFFGLDFQVTPAVLIPRPETELLVELALKRRPQAIADVGTGSGIIAITLAVKLSGAQVVASDLSPEALAVASANAKQHNVTERITFLQSELLESYSAQRFDLICANLPYIPAGDLENLEVARHEPRLALDGGPDGLSLIRRLLTQAPRQLAPGGRVLLEIEYRQGQAVGALAREAFPGADIHIHQDLAGLDRVVEIVGC